MKRLTDFFKLPKLAIAALVSASLIFPLSSLAHHSFAIFDFEIQTEFKGEVSKLRFKNPHMSMLLKTVDENGNEVIVDFIEGAPANMLVRNGLKPSMIKVGTEITVFGSPLREDTSKFFIRKMVLEDGSEF